MATVQPDHPHRELLFRIEGPSDDDSAAMEALVDQLADAREWSIAPPEFFDFIDDDEDGDMPLRIVGGSVEFYSALPPWGDVLPVEMFRTNFEEVRAIVDNLRALSAARHIVIALEIDQDSNGWIEDGKPDELVTVMLLGEWERVLRERESSATP